jgi:hypothetical protein
VDRDRLAPLAVALLAVLAFGAAAATLETAHTGRVGTGGGDAGVGGDADSVGFGAPPASESETGPEPIDPALLQALLALAAVVGAVVLVRWLYEEGLAALRPLIAVAVPVAVLLAALSLAVGDTAFGTGSGGLVGDDRPELPGGGADAAPQVTADPSLALAVVVGSVLVVASAVVVRSTGEGFDDGPGPSTSEEEVDPDPAAAVGATAGRAADRIEDDAPVSNAVYRAWREMTDHLDVAAPESSTPGEFAEAAVEAGMDPEAIRELTALFEATRYGDAAPTEDRERRAVAALRRIGRAGDRE